MATPTQDGEVLQHLLEQVLSFDPDSLTLILLRERFSSVSDLVTQEEEVFQALSYTPRSEIEHPFALPTCPLPRGHVTKLQLFVRYASKLQHDNGGLPLTLNEWKVITQAAFDAYRLSYPPCTKAPPTPPCGQR